MHEFNHRLPISSAGLTAPIIVRSPGWPGQCDLRCGQPRHRAIALSGGDSAPRSRNAPPRVLRSVNQINTTTAFFPGAVD